MNFTVLLHNKDVLSKYGSLYCYVFCDMPDSRQNRGTRPQHLIFTLAVSILTSAGVCNSEECFRVLVVLCKVIQLLLQSYSMLLWFKSGKTCYQSHSQIFHLRNYSEFLSLLSLLSSFLLLSSPLFL